MQQIGARLTLYGARLSSPAGGPSFCSQPPYLVPELYAKTFCAWSWQAQGAWERVTFAWPPDLQLQHRWRQVMQHGKARSLEAAGDHDAAITAFEAADAHRQDVKNALIVLHCHNEAEWCIVRLPVIVSRGIWPGRACVLGQTWALQGGPAMDAEWRCRGCCGRLASLMTWNMPSPPQVISSNQTTC